MRKNVLTSLLFISLIAIASDNDFTSLKNSMNEKSLPLINITVDIDNVSKEEYTEGKIEIAGYQNNTDTPDSNIYLCKVKYRGASSLAYDKKSFAIKLYDEDWENLDVNIMGIRETNKWILDAMAIDRIRMRNRLCFDIWNEYSKTPYETDYEGRNGTKGQFFEVFVNGNYHGLYCLTDKIERKLLGLKKPKEQNDGSVNIRGILYKCNLWCDAAFLAGYDEEPMDGVEWNNWELQEPEDYPSIETWTPLKNLIDFCKDSNETDFANNYKEHFYKDNLIDYGLLLFIFNLRDNVLKNTFLSTVNIEDNETFLITPWDLDCSLGGDWNGAYYDKLTEFSLVFNLAKPYYRLYNENVDNFVGNMKDKWLQLSSSVMSKENISNRIDIYAQMFVESGAWQREYEKWNNNPVPLKENITDETTYVKNWYDRNFDNVNSILYGSANRINYTHITKDENISVYNINGMLIYNGDSKSYSFNDKHGIFIIKNNGNTSKIVR